MDERCLRPLFCTIKAELGRGQPGLMRWSWDETLPQCSIDRSTLHTAAHRATSELAAAPLAWWNTITISNLCWDQESNPRWLQKEASLLTTPTTHSISQMLSCFWPCSVLRDIISKDTAQVKCKDGTLITILSCVSSLQLWFYTTILSCSIFRNCHFVSSNVLYIVISSSQVGGWMQSLRISERRSAYSFGG